MSRLDRFVIGAHYYRVLYYDKKLLVPGIETWRYERRTTGDDGTEYWLFRQAHVDRTDMPDELLALEAEAARTGDSSLESSDDYPIGMTETDLHQILDLTGLLAVLQEISIARSDGDPYSEANQATLEIAFHEHRVNERIASFMGRAHPRSLHIQIRYTDCGCFVQRTPNGFSLDMYTHPLRAAEEDNRVTALMKERNLVATRDYLADMGRTRIIEIPLPWDPKVVALICADVLTSVYNMRVDDQLLFIERD